MLIKRLYLRNFRVFEDELDLDIPPGLVGIYGPNGAGKSTLLEAILFTLWGKARTTKEFIRSAGVGADCVTEVEFEHEGHLYLVRRMLKGINSTVAVEVHSDRALMSTGTKDAERYVESILGLDDAAFRASVFTEQKQLAAFSTQSPAERRRLVLQLLGITPLDGARDAARKDARELASAHDRVRGMLADLEALETEAGDAAAKAEAAEKMAADERGAAEAAEARWSAATATFEATDRRRQEHETLVVEGRGARQELDSCTQAAGQQRSELAHLDLLAAQLALLEPEAAHAGRSEDDLQLWATAATARAAAERTVVPAEPDRFDEGALETAAGSAAELRQQLAAAEALLGAAGAELERARQAAQLSSDLSGEADCPMCGQPLGGAFETVQAHRADEVAAVEQRTLLLKSGADALRAESSSADTRLKSLRLAAQTSAKVCEEWDQAARRRSDAEAAFRDAWAGVVDAGAGSGPAPDLIELTAQVERRRAAVAAARVAASEAHRIRGRLETRPELERSLAANLEKAATAQGRVETLRDKVRALGFSQPELDLAAQARDQAASARRVAGTAADEAALDAARQRERAHAAAQKLAVGRAQHSQLAALESDTRHVGRAAELLSEFRNTVVASVGPRLAEQAAELFAELTDHEYERLDVDPESYQLQITDAGRRYGLDRFSGSEVDLANLALRVAISEHIHFQSGGSVGLLVLDEVFGPLDEDRKARMLMALERLRGRFRQVLVVTHDSEIKDQLPGAIEVVKLPGRRATARVVGD